LEITGVGGSLRRNFFKYPTPSGSSFDSNFFPNSQNQWLFLKFKYPPKFGQDPPNQKEIRPRGLFFFKRKEEREKGKALGLTR
jgi:hypothetical protein